MTGVGWAGGKRPCRAGQSLSEVVIHAEGLLQLLAHPLVEKNLLAQVALHHVLKIELAALVEMVHLGLQGEAYHAAAPANAVSLFLSHSALITHALAFLHLGKGTWQDRAQDRQVRARLAPVHALYIPLEPRGG